MMSEKRPVSVGLWMMSVTAYRINRFLLHPNCYGTAIESMVSIFAELS